MEETKAELLTSHGYATFALAYLSGSGPFPGLIDLFGGLVSLVETRAALLASHGYATFALAYLYQEDLAQNLFDVELEYIQVTIIYLSICLLIPGVIIYAHYLK